MAALVPGQMCSQSASYESGHKGGERRVMAGQSPADRHYADPAAAAGVVRHLTTGVYFIYDTNIV